MAPVSTKAAAGFVQQAASSTSTSTKSYSTTFSSQTTAGDTILIGFDKDSTQAPIVTDSQGNTYTEIGAELTSPGGNHGRLYYAKNIKGGTDSITVTLSANTSYLESYISEYGGIDLTNPIDAQVANTGSTANVTSGNATTTSAGDIIYGFCLADWAATAGTGFAMRANLNNNLVEDKTAGSAGSYAATATANNGWAMQMAALRPVSTGDATAPSVPNNLTATSVTASTVSLSWTTSTDNVGVTGYKIYRGGTQIGTSTGANYTDSGLGASTAYSYTVSAYDAAGNNSAQSTALPVTTKAAADTTPPANTISAPANNATVSGTVTVTGTASDNVAVASVVVSVDGGSLATTSGTTSWTFSTNSLALANGTHTVAAVATDTSGNRATNTISVTVNNDTTPPSVPNNLTATSVTASTVSLSWTASTDNVGVTGYKIYRGGTQIGTSTSANYTDTGLGSSTAYSYTVSAYDAAGNGSAQSTALPVTTKTAADTTAPSVPNNLTATTVTASTASFSWTASTDNVGVTGYKIYRGGTQIGTTTVANYTDTGLAAATAYSYTAAAYDAAGNISAQSVALQVTTKTAADTTPPVITISSPANNATVSGAITVTGTASDNVAVASVAVSIDAGSPVTAGGTTSWTFSTNSLALANGTHTMAAISTDTSGNRATNTISVTVNNDTTPPSVPNNLTATTVTASTVSFSWTASTDNVGVTGYKIYRGGTQIGTTTVANYTDTGLAAATAYSYTAAAYDAAGNNSAQSVALQVTSQGTTPAAMPAFPLKVSSDGRSLVDQKGTPFFMVGDSPQTIMEQVSTNDLETYLADRAARGFNTLWIYPVDNADQTSAPKNYYGNVPFDGADFTNEDPAYWTLVDYELKRVASYGMLAVLEPCFVGLTTNDGYLASITNSSDTTMLAYGTWLGNRYKNYTNIMWSLGGDADPNVPGLYRKLNDLAVSLHSNAPNQLITIEASRYISAGGSAPNGGYSSMDAAAVVYGSNNPSWLALNWVYNTYPYTQLGASTNYWRPGALPAFMGEDWYEGDHGMTPLTLREESYWECLSGCNLGRIFGNDAIWTMGGPDDAIGQTWQSQLGSQGSVAESSLGKLFQSRKFWLLIPDVNNDVLTGGVQSGATLAVAAETSDGNTVIAYIPTQRTVTFNMAAISGSQAVAWWFNPQTGASAAIGTYSTSGSQNFTPPDTNDWVLVMDNAALGLGAPGTGTTDTTPPSQPTGLVVTAISASTVSLAWSAATDNTGVTGYHIYRNGAVVGTSAVTNFTDAGLAAATTYNYTVSAYDAAGNNSTQSSAIQATTSNAPPPTTPSNLTLTGSTPTSVSFAWSPSTGSLGVAGYQIFRNGLAIATTTNTAFVDANISGNTAYTYGVAAYDAGGNSSPQSTSQFSIQWNVP